MSKIASAINSTPANPGRASKLSFSLSTHYCFRQLRSTIYTSYFFSPTSEKCSKLQNYYNAQLANMDWPHYPLLYHFCTNLRLSPKLRITFCSTQKDTLMKKFESKSKNTITRIIHRLWQKL